MKFSCNTGVLNEVIMNVSLAVSSKSNVAALEGILVSAKDNAVKLLAYNLELGIETSIDAAVREEGDVVIPAKLFTEIIKKIESENVEISSDEHCLVGITGGMARFTILGIPASDFPELPVVGESADVRLPGQALRSMISQTLFAVAVSDAKPVQTGALFEISEGELRVVAVDGFRLALRREKVSVDGELSFIVPGKTLAELLKMLSDTDDDVQLRLTKNHILFGIGKYQVLSRLLTGDFLDYSAAIPKTSGTKVKVNVRSLTNSIERTSLLIFNRLKSPLKVRFDDDLITMSCNTTIGKAYDECPCTVSGSGMEMGFNSRYLLDALKYSESDEVVLEISGPLSPMKVLPAEGDAFLFLVLPMRLKTDNPGE